MSRNGSYPASRFVSASRQFHLPHALVLVSFFLAHGRLRLFGVAPSHGNSQGAIDRIPISQIENVMLEINGHGAPPRR